MMSDPLLRLTEDGLFLFWCPGCKCAHYVKPPTWTISGTPEAPTVNPSVLVTSGHYNRGHQGDCWCAFNATEVAAGREPCGFKCERCHLFIEAGHLRYLDDSTHELAGQTVPMEPL